MKRLCALLLLAAASIASTACYAKQDEAGSWWACETYQSANGPAEACYPLPQKPF
jgi:hypothetical protein